MSYYNRLVTHYENGITEVVDYEIGQEYGFTREKKKKITNGRVVVNQGRIKGKKHGFKESNVFKNCLRAKKKIRQLCNNNASLLTKFLTLTFAFDIGQEDIVLANKMFKKFIMRLNYQYGKTEYICVPELTERGVIHFHLLCNLPYIDKDLLETIWGHGKIYISKIDEIKNVGAYISSYVDKDFGKALPGVKHFFKSKGVVYPETIKIDNEKDCNLYNFDNLSYQSQNSNAFCGNVTTRIYDKNIEWS